MDRHRTRSTSAGVTTFPTNSPMRDALLARRASRPTVGLAVKRAAHRQPQSAPVRQYHRLSRNRSDFADDAFATAWGQKVLIRTGAPFGELPPDLLGVTVVVTDAEPVADLHTPLHTALHTPTPPNQNLLESHCDRLASPRGFEALLTGLEADADMPNATGIRLVA